MGLTTLCRGNLETLDIMPNVNAREQIFLGYTSTIEKFCNLRALTATNNTIAGVGSCS